MRVQYVVTGLSLCVLASACAVQTAGEGGTSKQRAGLVASPMKLHAADASVGGTWTRIDLPASYANLVVIATPEYGPSSAPVATRIRNAAGSSFELRLERLDNSGAPLSALPVHYVVAEAGVYAAASGLKMEAATFNSTLTDRKGSFSGQARSYGQAYSAPVVLGQVQTANDPRASLFWSRGSTSSVAPNSVLRVGKHVGEDGVRTRANETLGYLVIEAGSGSLSGVAWQAGLTPLSVRGVVGNAPFSQSLANPGPAVTAVASQSGVNNGDGSFALLASPGGTGPGLRLSVDEDNWGDSERSHGAERVAYLAMNPCPAAAAAGRACGNGGACRADLTCCPDADADGVCNDVDACAGYADAADADADGVPDGCDTCAVGPDSADADGDGVADGCDVCAGFPDGADSDGDGVADGCDVCAGFPDNADSDGDGKPDGCDRDAADCAAGVDRPGVVTGDWLVRAENAEVTLPALSEVWCVVGNLDVRDTALTSLHGLQSLVAVTGRLGLQQNSQLQSLDGLDALSRVGLLEVSGQSALTSLGGAPLLSRAGGLMLSGNPQLVSLAGLEPLTTLDALFISQNENLASLDGLGPITSTSGTVSLANNPELTDLSALGNLHTIGVDLWLLGNGALTSLHGLESLTHVGRTVRVSQHASLSSIQGLSALSSVGDHLELFGNPLLDECAATDLTARTQQNCSNCAGNLACAGQSECSSRACSAGACGSVPAPAGSPCAAGICDAGGVCVSPVRLQIFSTSDGSVYNPPATRDGVFNPGDEVSLGVFVFNDGDTPITQMSSVRIVTQDSAVSRVFPYPVVNNSVAAHGRGAAYPKVMVANDAPEGQVVTLTVEVDYLRNGNAETMRLPHTLVIGPGTPAPGVSLSLDLVGMSDGDFRNSNKDGYFAPGEIISIQSRVRNWVRAAAAIGSPTLTTTDPYVTATVGGALTPLPSNSLGPVDTKGLSGSLTLSPSAPVGHRVEFTVNLPYQMNGESGVASIPLSFVVSVP